MVVALLAVMMAAAPDTGVVGLPPVQASTAVVSHPVRRFARLRPTVPELLLPLKPTPAAGEGIAQAPGAASGRRAVPSDSPGPQLPMPIDYSDAYFTRLTIHKWASWAMLPLFGLAYYTGRDLYNKGLDAPQWERNIHGPVAATLAGLFVVNTVTGGLNLWEGRKDPNGRVWRTTHGLLMLLADAGFAAVGLTAPENETHSGVFSPGTSLGESEGNASLHRGLAIGSMAVAVVSWAMMLPPFRRE